MIFDFSRSILLACMLAAGCAYPAPVPAQVAKLKTAKDTAQWTFILRGLGLSEDSIKALDYKYASGIKIVRAETFFEDLDLDGRKEGVTQVIFETPMEYGKAGIEYLFLIHEDPKGKPSLMYNKRFAMMKCGYIRGSGMRFSFPRAAKGQGRKILFTVLDVRTCDPGGQEFTTRTDTLVWRDSSFSYLADVSPKVKERKGVSEGP